MYDFKNMSLKELAQFRNDEEYTANINAQIVAIAEHNVVKLDNLATDLDRIYKEKIAIYDGDVKVQQQIANRTAPIEKVSTSEIERALEQQKDLMDRYFVDKLHDSLLMPKPVVQVGAFLNFFDDEEWESIQKSRDDFSICTFALFIDGERYSHLSEIPQEVLASCITRISIPAEFFEDESGKISKMFIETDNVKL